MKKIAVTVAVLALGLAACQAKTEENAAGNEANVENAASRRRQCCDRSTPATLPTTRSTLPATQIDNAGDAVENAATPSATRPRTPLTKRSAEFERGRAARCAAPFSCPAHGDRSDRHEDRDPFLLLCRCSAAAATIRPSRRARKTGSSTTRPTCWTRRRPISKPSTTAALGPRGAKRRTQAAPRAASAEDLADDHRRRIDPIEIVLVVDVARLRIERAAVAHPQLVGQRVVAASARHSPSERAGRPRTASCTGRAACTPGSSSQGPAGSRRRRSRQAPFAAESCLSCRVQHAPAWRWPGRQRRSSRCSRPR